MDNVVEIVVRSKNETKAGFDSARVDASTLGDQVGETFSQRFANRIINLRARIKSSIDKSGSDIGDSFGETIHKRITEKLKVAFSGGRQKVDVDVDVDEHKQSFLSRMTGLGKEGGDKISDGLGGSLQSFFSGDLISLLVKAIGGGALAVAISIPLSAAISAAILAALGGGILALGIASALKDPRIAGALGELQTKAGKLFERFGEPFKGPVARALETLSGLLDKLAPSFDRIGQSMAPIIDKLAPAFAEFVENVMPGLEEAIDASKPIFETLAAHLPGIGDAISDFLSSIAESGPEAADFLDDFLSLVEKVIRWTGDLIGWLTRLYRGFENAKNNIKGALRQMKNDIQDAANFITGKIRTLQAVIDGLHGKSITINISRVIETALSGVQAYVDKHSAAGGIVGAAVGGIHNGLRWVGEQGPELMDVPAGTTVHSAADSQRMMRRAQGSGGAGGVFSFAKSGNAVLDELAAWMLERLQYTARTDFANDPALMFGGGNS